MGIRNIISLMSKNIPNHIGFIMDGNRRWAKQRGKSATYGHRVGYAAMKQIVLDCEDLGVKYISLYAFSTENWSRSKDEVDQSMSLIRSFLKKELKELIKRGVRIVWMGSEDRVPIDIVKLFRSAEQQTEGFLDGTTLAICFNYGGQKEIVDAVNNALKANQIIDESVIEKNLYGAGVIPDLDIIVRTSGEHRLSNFMMWRSAYAELIFVDKFWPDFKRQDLDLVIDEFSARKRRFGK